MTRVLSATNQPEPPQMGNGALEQRPITAGQLRTVNRNPSNTRMSGLKLLSGSQNARLSSLQSANTRQSRIQRRVHKNNYFQSQALSKSGSQTESRHTAASNVGRPRYLSKADSNAFASSQTKSRAQFQTFSRTNFDDQSSHQPLIASGFKTQQRFKMPVTS
jgi:hypothetical protein